MNNGSVNSVTIGLISALTRPNTSATSSSVTTLLDVVPPSARVTPLTTIAASHSATALTSRRTMKVCMRVIVADRRRALSAVGRGVVGGGNVRRHDASHAGHARDVRPGPRLRPALDDVPAYKPGRPPAPRPGVSTYKLSSNENPYPPLPGVVEAVAAAVDVDEPLPRPVRPGPDRRAGRAVRRAAVAPGPRHRQRSGCCSRSCRRPPAPATRCSSPGARSRPTRSWRHRRGDAGPGAAARRRAPRPRRRWPTRSPTAPGWSSCARPTTRPGRSCTRTSWSPSSTGCPTTCSSSSTRPTSSSSATRRPPTASRSTATGPTSRCCARSPRPTGWPGCGSASRSRTSRWPRRCARPRCRSASRRWPRRAAIASLRAEAALLERVDALVAERARVVAALADAGLGAGRRPRPTSSGCGSASGTPEFVAACEAAGIVVRPFGDEGVRVTIGEPEANDALLAVATALPAAGPAQMILLRAAPLALGRGRGGSVDGVRVARR